MRDEEQGTREQYRRLLEQLFAVLRALVRPLGEIDPVCISMLLAATAVIEDRRELLAPDDYLDELQHVAVPVLHHLERHLADLALDVASRAAPPIKDVDELGLAKALHLRPIDPANAARAPDLYRVARHLEMLCRLGDTWIAESEDFVGTLRRLLASCVSLGPVERGPYSTEPCVLPA